MIVVAVDASKKITDYALEWAVRNLTKTSDSVFLLAVLPSKTHSLAGAHRTHKSKTLRFFSGEHLRDSKFSLLMQFSKFLLYVCDPVIIP